MTLAALLERARRNTYTRRQRAREHQQRQALAAGKPVPMTKRENLELVAAAWTAQDFLNDLDALLTARQAQLYIVWSGKRGQLYVQSPAGQEVLQQAHKQRRHLHISMGGDMGHRINHFLDVHNIELVIGWVSGKLVLQCGNRAVSTTHCLRLIECNDGSRCRYMLTTEQPAPRTRSATTPGEATA
ncbi:MAG: hypothetical protein ACOH1V_02475 [Stenotrophomonas sp.]